jgi:hypothetical protein
VNSAGRWALKWRESRRFLGRTRGFFGLLALVLALASRDSLPREVENLRVENSRPTCLKLTLEYSGVTLGGLVDEPGVKLIGAIS